MESTTEPSLHCYLTADVVLFNDEDLWYDLTVRAALSQYQFLCYEAFDALDRGDGIPCDPDEADVFLAVFTQVREFCCNEFALLWNTRALHIDILPDMQIMVQLVPQETHIRTPLRFCPHCGTRIEGFLSAHNVTARADDGSLNYEHMDLTPTSNH